VDTSDRRVESGFVRGWGHVARGWRLLVGHRVLLLVALALGVISVFTPRLSDRLVRPLKQQPAVGVEQEDQAEGDLGQFPQLVRLYDVLQVLPRMPGASLGVGDAVLGTMRLEITWWVWLLIATVCFDIAVFVLITGLLVCLLTGLVSRGVLDWRAAARGGVRVFWRYLVLAVVPAFLSTTLSIKTARLDPALPPLALTGLFLVIEVLRLTLILAWFIIAVDNVSLVRAVVVSGSTVWRRFSQTAVVVLGIGLVRYLWMGPASRLVGYAWDVSYGKSGPLALTTAVGILVWSVLAMIGIWFCLSALSWWFSIREGTTPALARELEAQVDYT